MIEQHITDKPLTTSRPVFDYAALSDRLMGNEEIMRSVAEVFLADLPEKVELLKAAAAVDDVQRIAELAHMIKGSAASIGGMALSAHAFILEQAGKAGDLETINQGLPVLDDCFGQLRLAMEERLF